MYKRFIIIQVVEVLLIIVCIAIHRWLYTPLDLDNGIDRIEHITGYTFNRNWADLILHTDHPCDSIVMVKDYRNTNIIEDQMASLLSTDPRWSSVHIAENDAYAFIESHFSGAVQTSLHFRPVCTIDDGYYDYMFYNKKKKDIYGCLVDVDTGTIAMYIFLW